MLVSTVLLFCNEFLKQTCLYNFMVMFLDRLIWTGEGGRGGGWLFRREMIEVALTALFNVPFVCTLAFFQSVISYLFI